MQNAKILEAKLSVSRQSSTHGPTAGASTEADWINLLSSLPKRYHVDSGHVISSDGTISSQIDVILTDGQYSPLIFSHNNTKYFPVESVYAVFEVKQEINSNHLKQTRRSISTIRKMRRKYSTVKTINDDQVQGRGNYIFCGILALSSSFKPPLSDALLNTAKGTDQSEKVDFGCIANAGYFVSENEGGYRRETGEYSAGNFIFELTALLQKEGTVGPIDIRSYTRLG